MPLTRSSAGEASPNFHKGLLGRLLGVTLYTVLALGLAFRVHAAPRADDWLNEVARVRRLAENDVPRAYEQALQLEKSAPAQAGPTHRAAILNLLGRIELYLGSTVEARDYVTRALDLARQSSDAVGQLEALLTLSLVDVNEAKLDDLVSVSARSVALLGSVHRPDLQAETLLLAALTYRRFEQFDEAVLLSMQALEVAQRSAEPLALTYAFEALGITFWQDSGQAFKSQQDFANMLAQARRAQSKLLQADALRQLAGPIARGGDLLTAERRAREAVALCREAGAPFNLTLALESLAQWQKESGRRKESLATLGEVIALYEQHPNPLGLWYALGSRSEAYESLRNLSAAKADAVRAYTLARHLGYPLYWSESSRRLAAVAAASGDFRKAYELSHEAADLSARAARDKINARIVQVAERYKAESRQREIDELTRRTREQVAHHLLQQRWLFTLLTGCLAVLLVTAYFLMRLRRSHKLLEQVHTRLQQSESDIRVVNATLEQRVQARTAELRQQTRYLRTLIDALPMWVWLKDTHSRYLASNRSHANACGRKVEEIVGKTDRDLWSPAVAEIYQSDDLQVMVSRERKVREQFVTTTTGKYWMETSKTPVLDEDGTVLGLVGASRDISERKAAEAAREEALSEAQRLAQTRSEFMAQMSHELRTPLNAILGYTDLLSRERSLSEQQTARLTIIRHAGEHLLTLINDILDLARIEAGRLELIPTTVRLRKFLQTLSNIVAIRAQARQLEFEVELATDLPGGVRADEKRLRQVLLNLLDNAIKFTDQGRVRLVVEAPAPDRLRFAVHDTGIGIAAENLEAIFAPFEQVSDPSHRAGGAGLGLAISRQIARWMGSDIHVASRPGLGSTFSVELPLPFVDLDPLESESAGAVTGYTGERRRVLVLDDVADNRTLLAEMLREIGFEVAEASSGAEGIERAKRLRPDLILTDLVMSDVSGLELIRRLRPLPAFAGTPMIAVSANASERDERACLAQGANAFLPKPVDREQLLAVIASLLKLSWIRDPRQHAARDRQPGPEPGSLVGPPEQDLLQLQELARQGNMRDIVRWANSLSERESGRYGAFAAHVRRLAQTYQSQVLLRFAESFLQPEDVSGSVP